MVDLTDWLLTVARMAARQRNKQFDQARARPSSQMHAGDAWAPSPASHIVDVCHSKDDSHTPNVPVAQVEQAAVRAGQLGAPAQRGQLRRAVGGRASEQEHML